MIHKAIQLIAEKLESENISIGVSEDDEAGMVECLIGGSNTVLNVGFIYSTLSDSVTLFCKNVVTIDEKKLGAALILLNEVNRSMPLKAVIDDDMNISLMIDFPPCIGDSVGIAAFEMLKVTVPFADEDIFPMFSQLAAK